MLEDMTLTTSVFHTDLWIGQLEVTDRSLTLEQNIW